MTEKLQDLLKSGAESHVYRLAGRTGARTIAAIAEAEGWQFLHLDASAVRSKASFLTAAGETLHFPAWAGHNWDAFEELVNDLSWLPEARGVLLLLDRLSQFAEAHPDELRLAVEILETAAANRRKAGEQPLVVLVRGAGTASAHLASVEVGKG